MGQPIEEWDLSHLTPDEQQAFQSAITKTSEAMTYEEMAAYNKAAHGNIEGAYQGGKAGFGESVKDFQRQAYMYSYSDPAEDAALWAQRTLGYGGLTDENGVWIPGEWEDGLFYPADGQSPCLGAAPGTVDSQGNPVPPS